MVIDETVLTLRINDPQSLHRRVALMARMIRVLLGERFKDNSKGMICGNKKFPTVFRSGNSNKSRAETGAAVASDGETSSMQMAIQNARDLQWGG